MTITDRAALRAACVAFAIIEAPTIEGDGCRWAAFVLAIKSRCVLEAVTGCRRTFRSVRQRFAFGIYFAGVIRARVAVVTVKALGATIAGWACTAIAVTAILTLALFFCSACITVLAFGLAESGTAEEATHTVGVSAAQRAATGGILTGESTGARTRHTTHCTISGGGASRCCCELAAVTACRFTGSPQLGVGVLAAVRRAAVNGAFGASRTIKQPTTVQTRVVGTGLSSCKIQTITRRTSANLVV